MFGISARKNDGIPIVNAVTSVRWRLRNGNGRVRATVVIDTTMA